MAKTAARAEDFLEKLKAGLQPKFDAEIAEFRALKVKETGDANAQIHLWDWRYYANQLKKEKYTVDEEELRVYFPYQHVLDGMFRIYQRIFGLKFQRLDAPYKWVADLQLYAVSDSATGEPLGLFYLDMFPREGKYNHFAEFGIIDGQVAGRREISAAHRGFDLQFPVARGRQAVASRPPGRGDDLPRIWPRHALDFDPRQIRPLRRHERAGRFRRSAFANAGELGLGQKGAGQLCRRLPRSFQKNSPPKYWTSSRSPSWPPKGTFYRRQLAFGLADLALHTQIHADNAQETVPLSNKIIGDTFFPEPPDTAFVAYFGHLMGYDAGYYGYAWADAIAADMATVFANAPDGFFDQQAGRRLRREIYEHGRFARRGNLH